MMIAGLRKFSLIDYPEKLAAIIFTKGCNFLCPYCHNSDLISFDKATFDLREGYIFDFLKSRIDKLEGISITGGEPTLHKDLPNFIMKIKSLGFAVKLDTNGTNPQMLKFLINNKLLDYIAMDIKASLSKYEKVVNTKVNIDNIIESIDLIINSGLKYEFRTTVVKSQLMLEDIEKIMKMIKNTDQYFIQKFIPNNCLNPELNNEGTYSDDEINNHFRAKKNYKYKIR